MILGLWKPVIRLLSPAGHRGKLTVFIFHRVLVNPDPFLPGEPDAIQFDWTLRQIARNFSVLPFGKAVGMLKSGTLPAAAACITFDDGYKDNFSVALPILKRHGLVATFFIATSFLNGGRMWNDDIIEAVKVLPSEFVDYSEFGLERYDMTTHSSRLIAINAILGKLKYFPHLQRASTARQIARLSGVSDNSEQMMTADNVRALRAAGMEIGGHTHTHPILRLLADSDAYLEIKHGKIELETILSEPIDVFAYPNGNPKLDLAPQHIEMLKEAGYLAAATTEKGVGNVESNPFMVPRFTPWDRTPARFATRCALALAGRT